jgi:hypothetical protein
MRLSRPVVDRCWHRVYNWIDMTDLNVRPVGRNLEAIRFFYRAGFELLGRPELFMDLQSPVSGRWKPGPEVFRCSFKV